MKIFQSIYIGKKGMTTQIQLKKSFFLEEEKRESEEEKKILSKALEKGVNLQSEFGETILQGVIQNPSFSEALKLRLLTGLVKIGADIHLRDSYGYNIFIECCLQGSIPLAEKCLELGANIEDRTNHGSTALILCCCFPTLDRAMILFLIERGADTWSQSAKALPITEYLYCTSDKPLRIQVKDAMVAQRKKLLELPSSEGNLRRNSVNIPLYRFQENEIFEPKLITEIINYLLPK